MPEVTAQRRRALLLTADRQIDRRILLEAESLSSHGWTVQIVAMPLDTASVEEPHILRIGSSNAAARRESLVIRAYRAMRNLSGINRHIVRILKMLTWRFLVDPERFYERLFWPTIENMDCDVIVANDLPMLPVAAKLAARNGARLVYDSHELYCEQEFSEQEKERWRVVETKYVGRCDVVITVNESIAAELRCRYGLQKVEVILNAERATLSPAPSAYFHEHFNLPQTTNVLLFQGGLSAGRNLETLVRSMVYVTSDTTLVILGNGELSTRLRSLVDDLGLEHKVFLHEAVPQAELLKKTASAAAGVIPYQANCLNNYLCTPNKLFEFIAAGIPVLASNLPELEKYVAGLGIGLVGDTSTPQNMAKLIESMFADGARTEGFRQNTGKARLEINWEQEEKKLINIFEALR